MTYKATQALPLRTGCLSSSVGIRKRKPAIQKEPGILPVSLVQGLYKRESGRIVRPLRVSFLQMS